MKLLAKIAAIAASAALAVSALGCSSSQSSSTSDPGFQPQDIQVNDPGFAVIDEGKLRYGFVAVNPNEGHVAQDVIFTIEAFDASGSMIAGGGETIPVLYPGVETAGAGECDLFSADTDTPEVASLSIVAMTDSATWADTNLTTADVEGAFQIIKPRMSADDKGDVSITASVQMSESEDARVISAQTVELRAVALLFNESGQAMCGTAPMTLELNAESGCEFAESIQNAPAYKECNLYVTPNALL